ncbi:hypothetical protein TU77_28275 [Pseudomonas synxantha]|nr:hypothetical protein TU77_28275 [Pseudomonas synxantha]
MFDRRIDLIGLGQQHTSIHLGLAIGRQHGQYLIQRQSTGLAERDYRQLFNHCRGKLAASTQLAVEAIKPFFS